ncbi:hypothetical protein BH11ARM2_BH11ARM2_38280 [soil metagenome]
MLRFAVRYFVLSDDGNKYGPADVAALAQWVREGRLLSHQFLEEEGTGRRVKATEVPGLVFGAGAAPGEAAVGYPRPTYQDASAETRNAWIAGVAGLCCCPFIFGILGLLECKKGEAKGANMNAPRILLIIGLVLNTLGVIRLLTGGIPHIPR